jgi:hypothetical protein
LNSTPNDSRMTSMNDSKPSNQSPTKSKGILILFGVLTIWALIIAFGTLQTQASTDFRRPLIVLATMGVFLGVWAVALWASKKSSKR